MKERILLIGAWFSNSILTEELLITKAKRDGFDLDQVEISWLIFSNNIKNIHFSENIDIIKRYSLNYIFIPFYSLFSISILRKFDKIVINNGIYLSPIFFLKKFKPQIKINFLFSAFVGDIYKKNHGFRGKLFSYFYKFNEFILFKIVDNIVCISKSSYEYSLNIKKDIKKVFLKYPVVLNDFRIGDSSFLRNKFNLKKSNKIILSVGRLEKVKRFDLLIKHFKFLDDSFRLVLLGSGSQKIYLLNLIKKLDLIDKVFIVDFVEHSKIWDFYYSADFFVSYSSSESLGLVLLEAMCAGVPCIGSNVSGIRDSLAKGRGFLIDDFENKFILRNTINLIQNDNRDKMIFNSTRYIKNEFLKKKLTSSFWIKLFKN